MITDKDRPEETRNQFCTVLIFELAGQLFALNIDAVSQIIPMLKLTPILQPGDLIEGVFNLHGKIVPVVSLRRQLGLPPLEAELYTPIILSRLEQQPVGWIVDEVTRVVSQPVESIFTPGEILPEGLEISRVMSGLFYQGEHTVILLDPGCILRSSQLRQVVQALEDHLQATELKPDPVNKAGEQAPKPRRPVKRTKRNGA